MHTVLTLFVGSIGLLLLIAVFQVNNRRAILKIQFASCVVWMFYYMMMGGITASILIMLGAVRNYAFDRYQAYSNLVFGIMIAIFIIVTVVTWKDWTTSLALIATVISTTAVWQKDPRRIRILSLIVTPFWVIYNFSNASYLGNVGDAVTISSLIFAISRYDLVPYFRVHFPRVSTEESLDVSTL